MSTLIILVTMAISNEPLLPTTSQNTDILSYHIFYPAAFLQPSNGCSQFMGTSKGGGYQNMNTSSQSFSSYIHTHISARTLENSFVL